jgi:single-stranded-DNA-specific exonuclease
VDDCAARYAGRELPGVIVGWSATWHRGVVGIAAGRLARLYHRPALLFAVSEEEGIAVGSGRSVPGIDLHGFLRPWESRLERFGGHAQAIGATSDTASLEQLAPEWEAAAAAWSPERLAPQLEYDLPLTIAEVTPGLLERLARLEPFGMGNPEPVFRFGPCLRVGGARNFGSGHFGFSACDREGAGAANGVGVEVVAWQWGERAAASGIFDGAFEMLAAVEHDRYRNRPRLRLVDVRPVSARSN